MRVTAGFPPVRRMLAASNHSISVVACFKMVLAIVDLQGGTSFSNRNRMIIIALPSHGSTSPMSRSERQASPLKTKPRSVAESLPHRKCPNSRHTL
jgi:hypothetical protein